MVTPVDDNDTAAAAAVGAVSSNAAAAAAAVAVEATSEARAAVATAATATTTAGAATVASDAVVPAAVSNEDATDDSTNNKVCRFLISNLQGGRGYAKNDFRIDLLQSKHGLYDIAETVFDIMDKEKLTNDMIYSHLWDMTFNKKVYKNGWRRQTMPDSGEWTQPASETDIDEGEPRLFSGLNTPLEKGQKGKFGGESASFEYVLESITDMSAAQKDKTYPHVSKVANQISTKVEDDWLTPSQKSQCIKLQEMWGKFYSGNNSWKRAKRSPERAFTRAKPSAPQWGDELQIMGLLINADCKFKKCWTNIMQYAFVDRTESACSMRWYQLKKEDYRLKWYGKGKSAAEKISLAKRLAKSTMKVQLERKPKRERHPYANADEAVLREYAERDLAYENGY